MTVFPAPKLLPSATEDVFRHRRGNLIDRREALSTATGGLILAGSLALISGVWSIAVTVPQQLGHLQADMLRISQQSEQRLRRLEQNDTIQNDRILRLESQR